MGVTFFPTPCMPWFVISGKWVGLGLPVYTTKVVESVQRISGWLRE